MIRVFRRRKSTADVPRPDRLKRMLKTKLGLLRSIPFEESGTLPLGKQAGKRRKPD
jgi:hypothetical protein